MICLVDTNILYYRCDPRDIAKRKAATEVLRRGEISGDLRLPHQALVEFVNSVSRLRGGKVPLLTHEEATRQAELFMAQFPVLYPNEYVFRTALLGRMAYKLSWFDAHIWAYAEHYGIPEILSEDFEHGRMYGRVRVTNPFIAMGLS